DTGASWLPQPPEWARFARDVERDDPDSTLNLYRTLLAERQARALGAGTLEWVEGLGDGIVAFRNGDLTVVTNLSETPRALPEGRIVVASAPVTGGELPGDTTVWITA